MCSWIETGLRQWLTTKSSTCGRFFQEENFVSLFYFPTQIRGIVQQLPDTGHWQSVMSDLDTLIVTFQTQLSDVMETVVKTAMYEVTRLVEDGFLEEVKRRSQEVESLRMQLQWAEKKLSDQGGKEGGKTGRCVDCTKKDVELSTDTAEGESNKQQDGKTKHT